jgi:hypothetical protein
VSVPKNREDSTSARRQLLAEVAYYLGLAATTFGALWIVLQLWRANLTRPWSYGGDAVFGGATIKGMIEGGWLWTDGRLGAPGVMNLMDYPSADFLHQAALKLISLVVPQWAAVVNIYYVLGFVLISLTCAWSLRRLGISRSAAFFASVLYSFLPFHLLGGEAHLALSSYFLVPLVAVVAIELLGAKPPLVTFADEGVAKLGLSPSTAWLPLLVCALTGIAGIYYALLGCFFIALAGVRGWWRSGERARLISAAVLVGVVLVFVLANLSPFIAYRHSAGANAQVAERSFVETEVFGLKIAQMVLPVRDSRVPVFAHIRRMYTNTVVATFGKVVGNEADFVALGTIGTIGLIFMVLVAVVGSRRRKGSPPPPFALDGVGQLTVAGILLATVGGFGTVLAFGFSEIRAYNRIVVYLAFFAFLGAAYLFDLASGKVPTNARRWVAIAAAALLLLVGIFDQTTSAMVPDYGKIDAAWASTGQFVAQVEKPLSSGAEVFQLPYVPFPENPPVVKMGDYDHFKPYLQSTKIHWSYGAVKGRATAAWDERVSKLPTDEMVSALKAKGFVGVWVDRAGYADQGTAIVSALSSATASPPQVSADGRYAFFRLGQ